MGGLWFGGIDIKRAVLEGVGPPFEGVVVSWGASPLPKSRKGLGWEGSGGAAIGVPRGVPHCSTCTPRGKPKGGGSGMRRRRGRFCRQPRLTPTKTLPNPPHAPLTPPHPPPTPHPSPPTPPHPPNPPKGGHPGPEAPRGRGRAGARRPGGGAPPPRRRRAGAGVRPGECLAWLAAARRGPPRPPRLLGFSQSLCVLAGLKGWGVPGGSTHPQTTPRSSPILD